LAKQQLFKGGIQDSMALISSNAEKDKKNVKEGGKGKEG